MSEQTINKSEKIKSNKDVKIVINKKEETKGTNPEKIKNIKRTKSKKLVEPNKLEDVLEKSTNKINKIIIEDDKEKNMNTLKDNVWKHILNEIKYYGKKELVITAEEIKKCSKTWKGTNNQFEPRLLCKQDCKEDIPKIFRDYKINIISIKNGEYLLTKNSIYLTLEYPKVKINEIEKNDNSLLLNIGNSESSLIDNLRYSGLFEKSKYLGEKILFGPLLNGRHRCSFKTKIGNKEIEISGSQFETDACYESENKILLIECKGVNYLSSFNIRQLYYPYRTIYDTIEGKKEIITLFINKDKNNIIHIWKFEFENPLVMTSTKNIGYHKYIFD